MTYTEKLELMKNEFFFKEWIEKSLPDEEEDIPGMEQYSEENCMRAQKIFDDLIDGLILQGENATEADKLKLFEICVLALNDLDEELDHCFIETTEREDLCELIDKITIAAELNPADYADGSGIADEWRDW
jgi:hypothetical protein